MKKEDLVIGQVYYYNRYNHAEGKLKITKVEKDRVEYEVEELGTFFAKMGKGHTSVFCALRDFEPCFKFTKCPLCK